MIVDQKLCTGCGACVDACPNGAILMEGGKAFINLEECTSCQICIERCPTGAIQLLETVSPEIVERPITEKVLHPQADMEYSPKQSNWGVVLLSLVGQQLLPRMADVLMAYLERKVSTPTQERAMMTINPVGSRPLQRRRQRRGRFTV
jgi:Fe-S-cluster-containing hydrogenase component 2